MLGGLGRGGEGMGCFGDICVPALSISVALRLHRIVCMCTRCKLRRHNLAFLERGEGGDGDYKWAMMN